MLFTRQATERLLGILSKWHAATSCESLQEPKNSEQKRTFLQTDDECYASRQYCLFLTDGSQFGEWNSHQHRVPLHDHTEHFKCYLKKKNTSTGLPWWLSGEEPTCQWRVSRHGFWSPIQEDATCRRATEPKSHKCWTHLLLPLKPRCPRAGAPHQEKPRQREAWTTR